MPTFNFKGQLVKNLFIDGQKVSSALIDGQIFFTDTVTVTVSADAYNLKLSDLVSITSPSHTGMVRIIVNSGVKVGGGTTDPNNPSFLMDGNYEHIELINGGEIRGKGGNGGRGGNYNANGGGGGAGGIAINWLGTPHDIIEEGIIAGGIGGGGGGGGLERTAYPTGGAGGGGGGAGIGIPNGSAGGGGTGHPSSGSAGNGHAGSGTSGGNGGDLAPYQAGRGGNSGSNGSRPSAVTGYTAHNGGSAGATGQAQII